MAETHSDTQPDVQLAWPRAHIALITLNRPKHLNALTHEVIGRFVAALQQAAATPGCRVVVLTGEGRGFCAGMDIAAGVADGPKSVPEKMAGQEIFAGMIRTIRTLPQPVIAAVNGVAAGAGMAIALAADVRLANPAVAFHIASVKIGITAGECGLSYHLPRHIGTGKAFEYMLTGRPIPADDAERMGLISRVVDEGTVVDAALDVAEEIARNSPFAVNQTKAIMRANIDNTFEEAIALENRIQILAIGTNDAQEAMQAFVERRPPQFSGS